MSWLRSSRGMSSVPLQAAVGRCAPRARALGGVLVSALIASSGCSDDAAKRVDSRAVPREGSVRLTTVPSGAAVLVDGRERVGKTPLTLRRDSGTRLRLLFAKDGYRPLRRTVLVEGGSTLRILSSLEPLTGHVIVSTGPLRGAKIIVDGQMRGRTPEKVELPTGEHAITVRDRRKRRATRRVRVRADRTERIDIPLLAKHAAMRAKLGWLSVDSDVAADVYDGQHLLGATPLERAGLAPGQHELLVRAAKKPRREKKLKVRLRPGRHRELEVTLGAGEQK